MKKKSKKIGSRENIEYLIMMVPAALLIFIFMYLPMGGLVIAFQDYKYDTGFLSDFIGFKNFEFFFTSSDAVRILKNTLILNFSYIILGVVFAVIVALFMFQIRGKLAIKVYQTSLMLPYFLSWVIVGCMSYAFLNPTAGLLNTLLQKIGFEGKDWYSNPGYWPFILGFFSIWKGIGYNSIMYYAGLMSIDTSLFEAAELDGAGKIRKIIHICIPAIIPLICIMTLMSLGGIFRADFGLFYQITRNITKLYPTTDVIDTYVYRALRENSDIGMSSAVGFFQSVVGFVTIVTANFIVSKFNKENALF